MLRVGRVGVGAGVGRGQTQTLGWLSARSERRDSYSEWSTKKLKGQMSTRSQGPGGGRGVKGQAEFTLLTKEEVV